MRKETKTDLKIRRLNSVITDLPEDYFTLDELMDAHKKQYPRCTPTKQGLAIIMTWPRVKARKEGQIFKKENNGGI